MRLFAAISLVLLLPVGLPGQGIVDHGTTKPPPGVEVDWGNPINRGRLHWWLFNGAGSRVTDIAGGQDGVLTNMDPATDWQGSDHGGALDFGSSGLTESVNVSNFDPPAQGSLVFRIKFDVFTQRLFGGDNNFEVRTVGATLAADLHAPTGSQTNFNFSVDVWYDLVATWHTSPDEQKWYVDGVLDVETTNTAADPGTFTFQIGNSTNRGFNGWLDYVALYDRVITAEESRQIHHFPYSGILHTVERITRWFLEPAVGGARRVILITPGG